MGALKTFDLQQYINKYNTKVFVETGTGQGHSLTFAGQFQFNQLFSTEIIKSQVDKLRIAFCRDIRTAILHGNSYEILEWLLPKISDNIFFWLDAHYPGADLGLKSFDAEQNIDIRLPLEKELDVIYRLRKNHKDIILCDDLRIYEKCPQGIDNMDDIGCGHIKKYGLDFLDKFKETHIINKIYREEGYIEILPK